MATPQEPDPLQAALLEIRAANDGILTAAAIVEAAADPEHALHGRFEWNDEKAGHKYRVQQARQLVRVVRMTYVDKRGHPDDIRVFHSVPVPGSVTGRAYVPLDEIQASPLMSAQVRRQMNIEWRALKRRYEQFGDFIIMVRRELGLDDEEEEPLALGDEG